MSQDRDLPSFADFPVRLSEAVAPGEIAFMSAGVSAANQRISENWQQAARGAAAAFAPVAAQINRSVRAFAEALAPLAAVAQGTVTEPDPADDLEALVRDQVREGEPETGYDFGDPTFPGCPHPWCGEHWHGLAITRRMWEMRLDGEVDPEYRYTTDDSEVLCPGSLFDGEFEPPKPTYSRTVRSWDGGIVIIDESHQLTPEVVEALRQAMSRTRGVSAMMFYTTTADGSSSSAGGSNPGDWLALPPACTGGHVYSNYDHEFDAEVVRQLAAAPGELHAQHAARDFCGRVWLLPDGRWVDQVWRCGVPVQDIVDDTIAAVIARANETYGSA